MNKIDLSAKPLLKNHIATLKAISFDNNAYMCESQELAIDYDEVIVEYAQNSKIQRPKSVDAVTVIDGELSFIEFKSGRVKASNTCGKYVDTRDFFKDLLKLDLAAKNILVFDIEKNLSTKDKESNDEPLSRIVIRAKINQIKHIPTRLFGMSFALICSRKGEFERFLKRKIVSLELTLSHLSSEL